MHVSLCSVSTHQSPLATLLVDNHCALVSLFLVYRLLLLLLIQVLFHHQSTHEPAIISKLISQLHRSTGEVTKKRPRYCVCLPLTLSIKYPLSLSLSLSQSPSTSHCPSLFTVFSSRCLGRNCSAVVEVELSRPVCVEQYQDSKELGRFMLRQGGTTIAAGVITKVSFGEQLFVVLVNHCPPPPPPTTTYYYYYLLLLLLLILLLLLLLLLLLPQVL